MTYRQTARFPVYYYTPRKMSSFGQTGLGRQGRQGQGGRARGAGKGDAQTHRRAVNENQVVCIQLPSAEEDEFLQGNKRPDAGVSGAAAPISESEFGGPFQHSDSQLGGMRAHCPSS